MNGPSGIVPAGRPHPPSSILTSPVPRLITEAGTAAAFAWDEFFAATIRNPHTRAAYRRAALRFLAWLEPHGVPLINVTPGMVGRYFDEHPGSVPSKKLALAALRSLFDLLVVRQALFLNPAASVRTERYQVLEGKTPEIGKEQIRTLLASIDTTRPVGLRDRALIGLLVYTAARAGAAAGLRLRDFTHDGTQYAFRFREKGGNSRSIPCRADLQKYLLAYLDTFDWRNQPQDAPLFRAVAGRTGGLTQRPLRTLDVYRLVKRRLRDAGLPDGFTPHSFRVATITDLLEHGLALEDAQYLAGHADPRTTRLYDRRQKQVTRNTVERISI